MTGAYETAVSHRGKIPLAAPLALVLLALGCASDSLKQACPKSCHPLLDTPEAWQAGVGECVLGTPVCDLGGNVLECIGYVTPSPEVCDGLDNDCDRMVDEAPEAAPVGHCLNAGVCSGTVPRCEGAAGWVCHYPPGYGFYEQYCDGRDNDCDGFTDEDFPGGFCYEGPIGTEAHTPCHPGVLVCQGGSTRCVNQGLPQGPEVCDGIDNDCNGMVDEGLAEPYQVAVVMDVSGSMRPHLSRLVEALDSLQPSSTAGNAWALFSVGIHSPPNWRLEAGMGTFTAFRAALLGLYTQGAQEPTMDVIQQACGGMPLWTGQGQRLLLIFGDEYAQGSNQATWGDLADLCAQAGVQVHVWGFHDAYYRPIADASGGGFYRLDSDVAETLEALIPGCE